MSVASSESEIGGRPRGWAGLGRVDPLAVAVVVLVLCGLFQLRTCVKLVRSDQENLAGEEYNVVYSTQRLMSEGVLYSDPARPPFAVTQYGPLFYLVGRASARLAGLSADDPLGITRLLRGISLTFLLAQCAIVGVILRRHVGASRRVVLLAAVALLVFQTPWCLTARPDSMEVLLVTASTLLGLEAIRAESPRGQTAWLASALVCGVLAILAKQSGFIAGLIVLPPALVVLGWRRTLLACLLASIASALLAASALLPLGPAIRANVVGGVDNGLDPRAAIQSAYVPYLRAMAAPAAGALVASIGLLLAARRPTPSDRAAASLAWGALVSLAVAAALALKYGSALNYFNVFNSFVVLTIGSALATTPALEAAGWRAFVAAYLALFLPAKAYNDLNTSIRAGRSYAECAEVARRLCEQLGTAPGGPMFFSQDPRLDCLIHDRAAAPGKLVLAILYRRGVVDYSDFARATRDGTIRYCVTFDEKPADLKASFDELSVSQTLPPDPTRPSFLGASFEGFRPLFRVGPHTVYESPQNGNRAGSSESGRRSP